MTYLALARKWRPKSFHELVGQSHVVKALSNALDNDRVHHAYLFTGTRGIGKTTIARIFAKSLNCLNNGVSSNPCNNCESCHAVDEGKFVDLIEIDAASNTKVDDTREILDNVQYAPTYARYKIYLIDEVHMLSNHSFNALLKTLEEPPEHVKFILATTDPQKLPVTILSRCLQFFLKPLNLTQIADRISYILQQEKIAFDDDAVKLIARAGQGSVRDSLSLLDQAIVYGDNKIQANSVREMLGLIEYRFVQDIFSSLIKQDFHSLFETANLVHQRSPDYSAILDELLATIHQLSLLQYDLQLNDENIIDKPWLSEFINEIDKASLQLFYQIILKGKQDIHLAPQPQVGFEMVLLRLFSFQPAIKANDLDKISLLAKKNSKITELVKERSKHTNVLADNNAASLDIPQAPEQENPEQENPEQDKPQTDKSQTDKSQTDKSQTDKPQTDKSQTDKSQTDKSQTDKSQTDKSQTDKSQTDKLETDKLETDKLETDKLETDKLEAQILDKESIDAKSIDAQSTNSELSNNSTNNSSNRKNNKAADIQTLAESENPSEGLDDFQANDRLIHDLDVSLEDYDDSHESTEEVETSQQMTQTSVNNDQHSSDREDNKAFVNDIDPAISSRTKELNESSWGIILANLPLSQLKKQLYMSCVFIEFSNNKLILATDEETIKLISDQKNTKQLVHSLEKYLDLPNIQVDIIARDESSGISLMEKKVEDKKMRLLHAENIIRNDENIKKLMDEFDAEIISGSIKIIDKKTKK